MEKEKNDQSKAYLFGSILLVLQVKVFPDLSLPILITMAFLLLMAAMLGYVVGWRTSKYFQINPYISTRINDCWENFDRDMGRARSDAEAMEAFNNLSKCLSGDSDRK